MCACKKMVNKYQVCNRAVLGLSRAGASARPNSVNAKISNVPAWPIPSIEWVDSLLTTFIWMDAHTQLYSEK